VIIKNYHQLKNIYKQCHEEGLYLDLHSLKNRISTWSRVDLDDDFFESNKSISSTEFDQLRRWLIPISKRMLVFKGLEVVGHFLEYESFAFIHYPKSDHYEIYIKANENIDNILRNVELLSHNRDYHIGIKAA